MMNIENKLLNVGTELEAIHHEVDRHPFTPEQAEHLASLVEKLENRLTGIKYLAQDRSRVSQTG